MKILVPIGLSLCLGVGANAQESVADGPAQFAVARTLTAANRPITAPPGETLGTILFRTDSAAIEQTLWPVLQGVVARATQHPEFIIELEGHSDVRGSRNHNHTLSSQRVRSVAAFLVRNGISPARIETRAYGEGRASANIKDTGGQIFDRRVTVTLRLPGVTA